MNTTLTQAIDHGAAARGQMTLSNVLPLVRLPRLCEQLLEREGTVDARLHFARNAAGQTLLSGELRAEVVLLCQRCLRPMRFAIDTRFRLGVVADEAQARSLPHDVEALVTTDTHLDPLPLIEDELLLSLPIVARHEGEECRAPAVAPGTSATSEDTRGESPFAVLRELNSGKTPENH